MVRKSLLVEDEKLVPELNIHLHMKKLACLLWCSDFEGKRLLFFQGNAYCVYILPWYTFTPLICMVVIFNHEHPQPHLLHPGCRPDWYSFPGKRRWQRFLEIPGELDLPRLECCLLKGQGHSASPVRGLQLRLTVGSLCSLLYIRVFYQWKRAQ